MSIAKRIKKILNEKNMNIIEFAALLGRTPRTIYNMMSRDSMYFSTVEEWLDALDCEIVFRDKRTGKIYE